MPAPARWLPLLALLVGPGALAVPVGLAGQDAARDAARDTAPAARDTVPEGPPRPPYVPPRVALSLTAGTLGFSDLQGQPVQVQVLGEDGVPVSSTLARRTLTVGRGAHVTGSALVGLSSVWAVRLGAGAGRGRLEAEYTGTDVALAREVESLPAAGDASARLLLVEAALRMRIATGRMLEPYLELGLAGVRWRADPQFPGVASAEAGMRWGTLAGAGAMVAIRPGLAGRIQVSSRFHRTPFGVQAAGDAVGQVDTLVVRFAAPATAPYADPVRELTRLFRLEAGLSVELGAARRPEPPRNERPGSRSGSRP